MFIEEYGCMYHDETASVPCQVRLYVFQHFLCFNTPTISLGIRAAKEVIPLKVQPTYNVIKRALYSCMCDAGGDVGEEVPVYAEYNDRSARSVAQVCLLSVLQR